MSMSLRTVPCFRNLSAPSFWWCLTLILHVVVFKFCAFYSTGSLSYAFIKQTYMIRCFCFTYVVQAVISAWKIKDHKIKLQSHQFLSLSYLSDLYQTLKLTQQANVENTYPRLNMQKLSVDFISGYFIFKKKRMTRKHGRKYFIVRNMWSLL